MEIEDEMYSLLSTAYNIYSSSIVDMISFVLHTIWQKPVPFFN